MYFSSLMNWQLRPAIFFLSAIMLLQSASLLLIDTSFKANHEYIAAVLCENRDNPQLHCDGKCQLKKELNTEQGKEPAKKSLTPVFCQLFIDETPAGNHCHAAPADAPFAHEEMNLREGFCTTNDRPPTA